MNGAPVLSIALQWHVMQHWKQPRLAYGLLEPLLYFKINSCSVWLHILQYVAAATVTIMLSINTFGLRLNGQNLPDDIFKCIFLNENVWISIMIPLKFVPKGLINNIPVLVQMMAWRRPGDKPLSEPVVVILLTHICITRPQLLSK